VAFVVPEATQSLREEGWPANVTIREVKVPGRVKPLRTLVELGLLPLIARRAGVGLLHSFGTVAPAWGSHARAVTVHDLIYHHYPETFPKLAQRVLEVVVPLGARRADRVLADSQATKDDLVASYAIDAETIDVVHLGLGHSGGGASTPERELREKFELGERPVVLSVSAALAHKNILRLLDAFAERWRGDEGGPLLVLVGRAGLEHENFQRRAEELGIARQTRFTDWVEKPELEGLYRLASCFVYPTLLEGFGLPVLEAMSRGVPVACSNTSSLPEVAGDAAELFDPTSTQQIGAAIERVLADPAHREDLIARGSARAATFTWARAADATIASYEAAMRAHGG
jgi:glycosyltransferase involved in cell wall biosynthesis